MKYKIGYKFKNKKRGTSISILDVTISNKYVVLDTCDEIDIVTEDTLDSLIEENGLLLVNKKDVNIK
jgi:hypothetical protein